MFAGIPPPGIPNELATEYADMMKVDKMDFSNKVSGDVALMLKEEMRCNQPTMPEEVVKAMLDLHAIWDPGATSDMGSVASVLALDRNLIKESGGKLRGRWYKPGRDHSRSFKVANGGNAQAVFEVVWVVSVIDRNGKCLTNNFNFPSSVYRPRNQSRESSSLFVL